MVIPYDRLEPQTLRNVIESFVTREGTDYGEREFTLDTKIEQVLEQLVRGTAMIVYDETRESCDIVSAKRS